MARRESKILTTTADVMAELGGPALVSKLTGAPYKQCWDWSNAEMFPARYFVVMWSALLERGLWADPTLWRQSPLALPPARKRQLLSSVFRMAS